MEKLAQAIHMLRKQLDEYKTLKLNEASTRASIINPLLDALGWSVRNPREVHLEYPTIDKKFVDYALRIDDKPVLLIEAKPLENKLDDLKAVTQVIGYAANDGIEWCVLTNGINWRIYRSVDNCPAPEKLLFEVLLDTESDDEIENAAQQLWHLSKDEIQRGILKSIWDTNYVDKQMKKTIHSLLSNPPRNFINIIKNSNDNANISIQQIKESLLRIDGEIHNPLDSSCNCELNSNMQTIKNSTSLRAKKAWDTRRAKTGEDDYDETHHIQNKNSRIIALYRDIDQFCLSLQPTQVVRRILSVYISYEFRNRCFCSLHIHNQYLRIWLSLNYQHIQNPMPNVRDVSQIGHWGVGSTEVKLSDISEMDDLKTLIRQSYEFIKNAQS